MIPKVLPKFKKGDPIRAADIQALRDAIQRQRLMPSQTGGIVVEETSTGTIIAVRSLQNRFLAKTSSAITARVGAVPGYGDVVLQELDANDEIAATPITYAVFNYSDAAGGIPISKYCWIEKDMAGNWWIISAEC